MALDVDRGVAVRKVHGWAVDSNVVKGLCETYARSCSDVIDFYQRIVRN